MAKERGGHRGHELTLASVVHVDCTPLRNKPLPQRYTGAMTTTEPGSALRFVVLTLVRLYFPRLTVRHVERVPTRGPLVFVLNHHNGLLDPVLLRIALARPVRFLAKSTLFGNPIGRAAMAAFGAIPVYRARDAGGTDQGRREANERTFALCREALARGEPLALFPEGISHSDPRLLPFRSGAARIALSAEHAHGFALGVQVVPTALVFESKSTFRSAALIAVGEAIPIARYAEAYAADGEAAVDALTADMRAGLERELLGADTRELLEGVARIAGMVGSSPLSARDPGQRHERAKRLLQAYRRLSARDPSAASAIVEEGRSYLEHLRQLGVNDPWNVEVGRVRPWPLLRSALLLLVLAPFALIGALLSWPMYRLSGVLADRLAEEDVIGTYKLLLGMLLLPLGWISAALVGFGVAGWSWALAIVVAALPTAYLALRFGEHWQRCREAALHAWLRHGRPDVARALTERRQQLALRLERALHDAEEGASGSSSTTPAA